MFLGVDWLVLILYLVASVFVGLWVSRGKKNFSDYMLGGGKIPWVAVGISIIATSVSATTFLGAPADVYAEDMTFLMFNIGAFISIFIVGYVFIPRFRGLSIVSAYELLEVHFSRGVRRVAAVFYSLHLILRTGILLYAPSLVLSKILDINIIYAILCSAIFATIYTWYGGIKAVIWTDVLQFVVFFVGGLFVLWLVADVVGGFGSLYSLASNAGKTKWFNPSLNPGEARTLISAGFAYAVLEVAIRGCDQQFVQRYLSCSGAKEANKSSVLSMVLGVVVSLVFYWVGAALFVYYQVVNHAKLPVGTDVNQVFPHFILHGLPPGLTGLVVAAIFAAAMSSLSSAINALANTTEVDILGRDPQDPKSLGRAKIWTVLWATVGVVAAVIAAYASGSLLQKALFFTGLFTGPLLAIFILSFFRPRTNPAVVIFASVLGMFSLILFNAVPVFPNYVPPFGKLLSWPRNPLISLSVAVISAVVIDFIILRAKVNVSA